MDSKTEVSPLPPPPVADRRPRTETWHGYEATDDYAWLRASNWQEVMRDPSVLPKDIRAYLEAENAYSTAALAETSSLQAALFNEMKARIKEDDATVPEPHGPFAYYTSYVTGGQHPLYCRSPREGGTETILINGNHLAANHPFFSIGTAMHSPDHRLVAYAADFKGSEFYTVHIVDADTQEPLSDTIPDTAGNFVWTSDSQSIFYVRLDENHRPRQVYRHILGTPSEQDVLIYEEADSRFYLGINVTQDHRYITIDAHDHQTSEIRLIDACHPDQAPRLVAPREREHEYTVDHHEGRLIILTNADGAEDFKIVEAPAESPGRENWRTIESHRSGRLIIDATAFKDHLVRLEREDGLPRVIVRRFSDGAEHAIAFAEEAYSLAVSPGHEFDTHQLRFTYSSMTTPAQVFDYDMETRERYLRKTQEVPSGHDPANYVTQRVMAPSVDGETVPVSILYRADTPLDGSAPLLLYGYGAYGISIPASFSTNRLSLVDRGFVYAIAHVRGGKEKGYRWYRDGKLAHKENTFTDFISAARYLRDEKLVAADKIVGYGASAGGMLMGAVANMAPELFKGIIAEVPFVDVLATMLDDTLPLTPPEWMEWGNPITSKQEYERIAGYSPYDNVTAQAYPHILALSGLTDPRVTYWEPAKWVARLRALRTDNNLTLLRTNMEAGHGGASGRFDRLREVALAYAFALMVTGKTENVQ